MGSPSADGRPSSETDESASAGTVGTRNAGDGGHGSDEGDQGDARFTEGDLTWPLLALAGPIVATQLLQVLYNLTDTFWVGRMGADAVSAISFAWPIVAIILSIGGGIGLAGTILVAQHSGAGDQERVDHVAGQTMAFATLLSAVLGTVGFLLTPWLLRLIGSTPGTNFHAMAVDYTRLIFLGVVFTYGFYMFQGLLRGWGDTKTPMYLMVASVGLNVLADPFFILGFQGNPLFVWLGLEGLQATLYAATGFSGWGVAGAAVATVGSRALAVLVGAWLMFGGRVGVRPSLADLRLRLDTVAQLVRVGAPVSVESLARTGTLFAMTAIAATAGPHAVAAFGIGHRFTTLASRPAIGMGMATDTVVGQNVGAERSDRARRTVRIGAGIVAVGLVALSAFVFAFADPIARVFVDGEGATTVVGHTADFLRIVAPTYALMGVYHVVNGAFHGSGSTKLSMSLGIAFFWGVQVVAAAAFVFVLDVGASGVWYGFALSHVTAMLGFGAFHFRDGWTDRVVADDEAGDERATPAD